MFLISVLSSGFCHGKYTFALILKYSLTKPGSNDIMEFICQLAALFSELLILCDNID